MNLLLVIALVLVPPPEDLLRMAGIVNGEASYQCWEGMLAVACTLKDDYLSRGPNVLYTCPTCRWQGFRATHKSSMSYGAVLVAWNGDNCKQFRCGYLGANSSYQTLSRYPRSSERWLCNSQMICFRDMRIVKIMSMREVLMR